MSTPATFSLHATAVAIGEAGILIRGASGSGKSSLAMDLIFVARHQARFASLVGDDRIDLDTRGGRLVAQGHHLIAGLVEQRGLGFVRVPYEPAVVVRLMVDIVARREAVRFPETEESRVVLGGIELPVLALLEGAPASDGAVSVLAYLERAGMI